MGSELDEELRECYQVPIVNLRGGYERIKNQDPRGIHLEFPKFVGEDVFYWVDKVEQYFGFERTNNED